MKEVRAYVKPHKLPAISLALHRVHGLTGVTLGDVRGMGRGISAERYRRDAEELSGGSPHVRIEIFCEDALVAEIVRAIQEAAHTGLRGDGKIYVLNVEDAVRISSGEHGEAAI